MHPTGLEEFVIQNLKCINLIQYGTFLPVKSLILAAEPIQALKAVSLL